MSDPMEQRRFVVLEHEWNGVHWDFMIEDDGRLRTWAIDAPPSRAWSSLRGHCRTIGWIT